MTQTVVEVAEARAPIRTGVIVERAIGWLLVAAVALWLLYQFVQSPSQFFTITAIGLNQGALYALVALGYTLVYGIIELINFSHGDLFMLASVLSAFLMVTWFGATDPTVKNFALMGVALIVVMAFAALVNTGAERFAYRRLRRAPKLAPLITAVGLSFVYQQVGLSTSGSGPRNWPRIITGGFTVGNVAIPWSLVVVLSVTIPLLMIMTYLVQRTRQGKAMRATAQDQDAARLMGIDVDRTIAFTFALGGALAGAGGLLYMESLGTTRYDAGFQLGLIAFTSAVLGGIGNLNGAVLGGFIIGIIQAFNDTVGFGVEWSQTVVFTILIALMVFRPEGILGHSTTEKV